MFDKISLYTLIKTHSTLKRTPPPLDEDVAYILYLLKVARDKGYTIEDLEVTAYDVRQRESDLEKAKAATAFFTKKPIKTKSEPQPILDIEDDGNFIIEPITEE